MLKGLGYTSKAASLSRSGSRSPVAAAFMILASRRQRFSSESREKTFRARRCAQALERLAECFLSVEVVRRVCK